MPRSWSTPEESVGLVELRRGRWIATVAILVVLLAGGLVALGLRGGRSADESVAPDMDPAELAFEGDASAMAPPPVIPTLEGALVMLSEGALSVPVMDLDVDLAPLFGPTAPPTDVLTVGSVALAWRADGTGPIVAVELDGPGDPVAVAPRGRLLASSVPGRFWLVQLNNGTFTVTEFDAGGATVAETLVPGEPVADSGRGIVVRRDGELSLWNPYSGEVVGIGAETPFVAAAAGRVVRCPERCDLIQLVGGPIPDVESVIEMPGGIEVIGEDGFSVIDADARRIAVAARMAGRPHAAVVDLDTGSVETYRLPGGDVEELAWVDGRLIAAVGDRILEIDPVTATIADVLGGPPGPIDAIAAVAPGAVALGPAVLWGAIGVESHRDAVYVSRPEELSLVPADGDPLVTVAVGGTVIDMAATDGGVWLAVSRDDRYWLESWAGEAGAPPVAVVELTAAPVDLATDGTRVAALLQDGSLWLDGTAVPAVPGVAVELVAGRPWILDADGRAVVVDPESGQVTDVASFAFGAAVDTAASGGRFWVLDDAGRVLAEQPDGLFHYQSARLANGGRALAVDGPRVLAAGADGEVWAFQPGMPVQIVARLPLAVSDGDVVDLAAVGDEVWYVTATGQLRREPLTAG